MAEDIIEGVVIEESKGPIALTPKEKVSPKALDELNKIRGLTDEGWWIQDTPNELRRGTIALEPLSKKTAAKVELVSIKGAEGNLGIDTFKPTHALSYDKPIEGTVVAQVKLNPYLGDRGRINDMTGEYQLLSTGKWMVSEPMSSGGLHVKSTNETPKLIKEYLLREKASFHSNQVEMETHIQSALDKYSKSHAEDIEKAAQYHPDNEFLRKDSILATIASRVDWDKTIPDEDRTVLGFAANMQRKKLGN